MKILHTSDWQLGKPYARVGNPTSVALLQQERISAIKRLGIVARERGCLLIVVAGDLFDSSSVEKATVFAACAAIAERRSCQSMSSPAIMTMRARAGSGDSPFS